MPGPVSRTFELALQWDAEIAGEELRLLAAAKLYEMGRLSSGAAASLAGVPRTLFSTRLADYGVPTVDLTADDLRNDFEVA